jgi:hypothetical protein
MDWFSEEGKELGIKKLGGEFYFYVTQTYFPLCGPEPGDSYMNTILCIFFLFFANHPTARLTFYIFPILLLNITIKKNKQLLKSFIFPNKKKDEK